MTVRWLKGTCCFHTCRYDFIYRKRNPHAHKQTQVDVLSQMRHSITEHTTRHTNINKHMHRQGEVNMVDDKQWLKTCVSKALLSERRKWQEGGVLGKSSSMQNTHTYLLLLPDDTILFCQAIYAEIRVTMCLKQNGCMNKVSSNQHKDHS